MTATIPREWDATDAADYDALPPDLTQPDGDCPAEQDRDAWPYLCTRARADHTGRHAAGDGTRIVAVWGDPS